MSKILRMDENHLTASDLRNSEYCFGLAEAQGRIPVTRFGKRLGFIVGNEEGERVDEDREARIQAEERLKELEVRDESRLQRIRELEAENRHLRTKDGKGSCQGCAWAWAEVTELRGQNNRLRLDNQLVWNRISRGASPYVEGELPFFDAAIEAISMRECG